MSDESKDFSADALRALACVLDDIIPPSADGKLPGAGELGLAGYIEDSLRPMPALKDMTAQSLAALDDLAQRRHGKRCAELTRPQQSEVIAALASTEHGFPPFVILYTYGGYYQHPKVLAVLGLEPRAPHPKGYAMEPNDLTLLEPVRRRPKTYREC